MGLFPFTSLYYSLFCNIVVGSPLSGAITIITNTVTSITF